MKIRYVFILVAAMLSTFPSFAAGGQEVAAENKEQVAVTALIPSANQPSEQNAVLIEIYNRTGIEFSPIVVPNADYMTKLNAMIASKTVPHIISFGQSDGEKFIENSLLLKLNVLLEQYGPEIMDNKGKYMNMGLNGGGNIWAVPIPGGYPSNLSIRTDWLKNVGMDIPTDLDGLFEVLKAFTFNDPDGDGKDDTIGYGGSLQAGGWENIFAAFGVPFLRPIYKDGVVTSHINHPNYLDAIRYWRRLYQAEVMEWDFATIPRMQSFGRLWNGIYGVYDFTAVGTTNNWVGRYTEDPKPTFDFAIINGPEGVGGTLQVYGSSYYGITVNCDVPEQAMKLCNFLTTPEGDELLYLGVEGRHFRWTEEASGKFEYIPPYDDSATQRNDGGYVYWVYFHRHEDNTEIRTMNQITRKALKMGYANPIDDAFIFGVPDIQKELGSLLQDIEKECFAMLVVTEGDIETEYQKFVKRWFAEGGEIWEEQATRIYKQEHNE